MHHYCSFLKQGFTNLGGFMHSSCQGYIQWLMTIVNYNNQLQLHSLIKVQLRITHDCCQKSTN